MRFAAQRSRCAPATDTVEFSMLANTDSYIYLYKNFFVFFFLFCLCISISFQIVVFRRPHIFALLLSRHRVVLLISYMLHTVYDATVQNEKHHNGACQFCHYHMLGYLSTSRILFASTFGTRYVCYHAILAPIRYVSNNR